MSEVKHMLQHLFGSKAGVSFDGMSVEFDEHQVRWGLVADYIRDVCQAEPVITSAKDSTHSTGSVHYIGKAIDLRIRDWKGDARQHSKAMAWLLGVPWVVVYEPAKIHVHIQTGMANIVNPKAIQSIGGGGWIE